MASGMCIVSTNAGGLPDLLKNEADALLVPPNEPDTMAEAVTRILDDASLAEWLSLWARRAVKRFDWKVILPIWESLLSGIAAGGGMRAGCRSMGDVLIDVPSRRPAH
jgi:glycosyltransferase involved in cell wall biosynthesis